MSIALFFLFFFFLFPFLRSGGLLSLAVMASYALCHHTEVSMFIRCSMETREDIDM